MTSERRTLPTNATHRKELIVSPSPKRVEAVHRLLKDEMAPGLVEDLPSLIQTLSPSVCGAAVPLLVCASDGPALRGAMIGSYLTAVNVGMILYGAVARASRGQGIYRGMRNRLTSGFGSEASRYGGAVDYTVSEQQPGSSLLSAYLYRWGAYEAARDYEQPPVQGLERKPLKLVFLPVGAEGPPSDSLVTRVIREIYKHVYRIEDPEHNESFRRIVQSTHTGQGRARQSLEPPVYVARPRSDRSSNEGPGR